MSKLLSVYEHITVVLGLVCCVLQMAYFRLVQPEVAAAVTIQLLGPTVDPLK